MDDRGIILLDNGQKYDRGQQRRTDKRASDLCHPTCPNNGICKYRKETQELAGWGGRTGRNVAIFDFRFRVNIFRKGEGKQRATYWPTTIEVRAHTTRTFVCKDVQGTLFVRIPVCMQNSDRMSLPNRKSTCVRLKCFCTYFYCECLSNFPAYSSTFSLPYMHICIYFFYNFYRLFISFFPPS